MEDKARFVFPVVITAIIARGAMVVRLRHRLADRGQHRYLAIPFACNLTQRVVAAIERT